MKNLPANVRDAGSIPVLKRPPGEGNGKLLEITSEMTQNKTHKRQTTHTLQPEEQNWAKN